MSVPMRKLFFLAVLNQVGQFHFLNHQVSLSKANLVVLCDGINVLEFKIVLVAKAFKALENFNGLIAFGMNDHQLFVFPQGGQDGFQRFGNVVFKVLVNGCSRCGQRQVFVQ